MKNSFFSSVRLLEVHTPHKTTLHKYWEPKGPHLLHKFSSCWWASRSIQNQWWIGLEFPWTRSFQVLKRITELWWIARSLAVEQPKRKHVLLECCIWDSLCQRVEYCWHMVETLLFRAFADFWQRNRAQKRVFHEKLSLELSCWRSGKSGALHGQHIGSGEFSSS